MAADAPDRTTSAVDWHSSWDTRLAQRAKRLEDKRRQAAVKRQRKKPRED